MYVEKIEVKNFRNYDTMTLNLDQGTNIFYGDNAQGKTNVLEAVYLCGTTKSQLHPTALSASTIIKVEKTPSQS